MADPIRATISEDALLRGWLPRRVGRRILALGECTSTNDSALGFASREAADGLAVVADHQTAGRGRQGRPWVSPRAASILCSIVIEEPLCAPPDAIGESRPFPGQRQTSQPGDLGTRSSYLNSQFAVPHSQLPPLPDGPGGEQQTSGWLTLAAAVAACEAIRQSTDVQPAIKWPNDLRVNGRKLAGVLIESRSVSSRGIRAWVLGIGINCLQQPGHFPPDLRDQVTSLEIESREAVDRIAVARSLLQRLDAWLSEEQGNRDQGPGNREPETGIGRRVSASPGRRVAADAETRRPGDTEIPQLSLFPDPSSLHDRWLEYAEPLGGHVRLVSAGREYSGRTLWVDPAGGLVVQCDDGTRAWFDPMQTRIV